MSTITNSKSLVNKITHNSDKFIKSKWSLITFISLVVIAGTINYLLFGFGQIEIETPWLPNIGYKIYSGSDFAYIAWISMTLSVIGSIFNIWAFILITRFNKNFIWFSLIACAISVPNEFFLGAVFTSVCFLILTVFEVKIHLQWKAAEKEGTNETIKPVTKKNYIALAIIWTVFIIFGLSVSLTSQPLTKNYEHYLIPVMDVLVSSVVLVCWSLALMKNRWGLLGLVFNDFAYMVMYIILGAYSISVTFLIFVCMNITGFLGWSKKE